jgi:hypothetical protein
MPEDELPDIDDADAAEISAEMAANELSSVLRRCRQLSRYYTSKGAVDYPKFSRVYHALQNAKRAKSALLILAGKPDLNATKE